MVFKYAYILPIVCAVWFYTTFAVTYIISVYKKDVTPLIPYISDTGTWSPESCIFGVMLNIGALMRFYAACLTSLVEVINNVMLVIKATIMYIRHRQVKFLITKEESLPSSIKKHNRISLVLGIIATFGVFIVANFQETNVFVVHVLGAMAAFGLGSIYQGMQSRMSFQLYPIFGNKKVNVARVFCTIISSVTFLVTFLFAGISFLEFHGKDPTKWAKNDGGYTNHFVSVVAEWIMAITTIFFLLLYTQEFKNLAFDEPPLMEVQEA